MPAASSLIIALLALIAVGASAWALGRRAGRRGSAPLTRDEALRLVRYLQGPDGARGESPTGAEGAELDFQLGALFRRRGEFDRATQLHERLEARGEPALRERARFELALDFLSAGLMDRAERLLHELTASPTYRREALERLVRLHERQGDWSNALSAWSQLPPADREARRVAAAHYLCELADQALLQGDPDRVDLLLRQAATQRAADARIGMLHGRLEEWRGNREGALQHYVAAARRSAALLPELLPQVARLDGARGGHALPELRREFIAAGRISERQFALLLEPEGAASTDAGVTPRAGDDQARYVCMECGLRSVAWAWHCPACFAWERFSSTVIPRDGS